MMLTALPSSSEPRAPTGIGVTKKDYGSAATLVIVQAIWRPRLICSEMRGVHRVKVLRQSCRITL